jgi:signal transduction histidine kinase
MRNLAVSFGILGLLASSLIVLVAMARRTQALAQQQIDFVAGISHELHTPLATIRSAGENLADGVIEDGEKIRRYGRMIASEGRRLSQLLGNVLEYAGIQSGAKSRSMREFFVEEAIENSLRAESGLLDEAMVQVERSAELPETKTVGDQAALESAIQNLIENAVKYGGRGKRIVVGAAVAESPEASVSSSKPDLEVRISVEDEGPGVSERDLPRIFNPFFRGAIAAGGAVPGSGLGLSVVKQIAEAHGGRVSVGRGRSGVGSIFTLHLPLSGSGMAGMAPAARSAAEIES